RADKQHDREPGPILPTAPGSGHRVVRVEVEGVPTGRHGPPPARQRSYPDASVHDPAGGGNGAPPRPAVNNHTSTVAFDGAAAVGVMSAGRRGRTEDGSVAGATDGRCAGDPQPTVPGHRPLPGPSARSY